VKRLGFRERRSHVRDEVSRHECVRRRGNREVARVRCEACGAGAVGPVIR
jgi:hypothetical protein